MRYSITMRDELEENAREELKRADHLIYVTLKYTRTADVIHNTIKRLIAALDFSIEESLEFLLKKKKIKEIPRTPLLRAELLDKKKKEFSDAITFYFLLRTLIKSDYIGQSEFRKGVTMVATLSSKEKKNVDMETLKGYFEKTIMIVQEIEDMVHPKNLRHSLDTMSERTEIFMRIIVGLVSGLIIGFWKVLVQIVAVLHWFYVLFVGKRNKDLALFCEYWNSQIYKFARYMTFNTNERPFPFNDLGKNVLPYSKK
jgi:hypothetical protein